MNRENINKNDLLKIIAIISMIIDHIGYVIFPEIIELRMIGRISFPIFAYQITLGYIHTSDLKRYKLRLLIFAIISQIPYILVFPTGLNIFFNLLIAVYAIEFFEKKRYLALAGLLIYAHLISHAILFGYGIYGILLSIVFYRFSNNHRMIIILFTLLTAGYSLYRGTFTQIYAVFAIPIILRNWKYKVILNKWLFYLFYPIHLLILYGIDRLFL